MKYKLIVTKQFDRHLKKCLKRGLDENKLEDVINQLLEGKTLPKKYRQHRLNSKFRNCWECHVEPDWLLLWNQNEEELILLLIDTGTHSDIFG